MVDPDDAAIVQIVGDALDQLVLDADLDPADACGALAVGALIELADLGDVRSALVVYRATLEHLLAELGRLEAGLLH
jgi:hypothetical protein